MPGLTDGLHPYRAPVSGFTTPGDAQRERISGAFGWDVGRPGMEFLRRLFTSPQAQLGLGMRSPIGARVGNDHAWASQTGSGVLGGGFVADAFAQRHPFAFRDRGRAPFAEPPQLPPANNNRPFLRREDQVANPYDYAVAWQRAMQQRPTGGRD